MRAQWPRDFRRRAMATTPSGSSSGPGWDANKKDRLEVRANVRACDMAFGQPHFGGSSDQHHPGIPSTMRSRGGPGPRTAVRPALGNECRAASAAEVGTFTDSFPLDGEEDFHLRAHSRLWVNPLQFVRRKPWPIARMMKARRWQLTVDRRRS